MRLDKFLKVAKIIKRRTVSHEIIDHGRVKIGDKVLKPGYQLKLNDLITIYLPKEIITIKIIDNNDKYPQFEIISVEETTIDKE